MSNKTLEMKFIESMNLTKKFDAFKIESEWINKNIYRSYEGEVVKGTIDKIQTVEDLFELDFKFWFSYGDLNLRDIAHKRDLDKHGKFGPKKRAFFTTEIEAYKHLASRSKLEAKELVAKAFKAEEKILELKGGQ